MNWISTSESSPLTFTLFSCWIKVEDERSHEHKIPPTTSISEICNHNPPYLGFHKQKLIEGDVEMWSLFTARQSPLILKIPEIEVYIEDQSHVFIYDNGITLHEFIANAGKKFNTLLKSTAVTKNGKPVNNL